LLTATQRATVVPPSPPSEPRLSLAPIRAGRAVLDGGWWPRSWDPLAELPGLVLALFDRYGPIRNLILSSDAWDGRFRRLAIGATVVRVGWFASLDATVLVATTGSGNQLDLLVVPPDTAAAVAERAMAAAADPTNVRHARDILGAGPAPSAGAAETGADPDPVRDDEGGHAASNGPRRRIDKDPATRSGRGVSA
jgi:hypothetical protein